MSGGASEYVMANYNNTIGESLFLSIPNSRYYNLYASNNSNLACNGGICYGHALSETVNWYNDNGAFVNSSKVWLERGGSYIGKSGIFYSDASFGQTYNYFGFRVSIIK